MPFDCHKLEARSARIQRGFPRGFTLIELLLVIFVMCYIMSISIPAITGMGQGMGMRGAVRSVHSTLFSLRQWAITHREQVTFHYFRNYQGDDYGPSYYYASVGGRIIEKTNELPMEVVLKDAVSPGKTITFKSDGGLASGPATETIYIYDRQAENTPDADLKKTSIKINGLTGSIRVE